MDRFDHFPVNWILGIKVNTSPSGEIYPDGVQKTRPLFPAFA
jgi:hypothetical protein